jgi:hypothetical protein
MITDVVARVVVVFAIACAVIGMAFAVAGILILLVHFAS